MRVAIPNPFRRAAEPESSPAPAPPPAAPPRDVHERVIDSVPVTYMDSPIPEVDSAFGYGHLDGRRGVDPENFRGFIHHSVDAEGIERRLGEMEADEHAVRARAETVRQRRADLAAGAESLRVLRERGEQCGEELRTVQARAEEADEALRTQRERGSYSHAVMFLVAGAVFILGDVVMTRKIVADALSLTGHRFFGIDESWVFAAGLAMISIVLKPAYDRLVEKPFWEHRQKRFVWVICTLALCSVATLWVLGAFRSDAYRDQQRLQMVMENTQLTPQQQEAEIARIQDRMLTNPLAAASFVLSGILFAAAGAVTLSIGLHYARQVRHVRGPALRQQRELAAALRTARERRESVAAALAARAEEMERLQALAADDPPPLELDALADTVAAQRRELALQLVAARQQRLRHLYDDGYELGAHLKDSVETDAARARAESRPRRKRPRPFVALRRSIHQRALTPESLN